MKKIILIVPYFGDFPNYFELWLESAAKNKTIDFLFITDNNIEKIPNNFQYINMSFTEFVEFIQRNYKFKINIPTPYRISTFKPAYGEIFKDYLSGYDFWGWCDIDLIFGDLRHFLTDNILEKYDKILTHGHLSLLRNNEEINRLYRIQKFSCMNYKDAFSSGELFNNFDEYPYGLPRIADIMKVKCYNAPIFADLDSFFFTFRKLYTYIQGEDDPENILQIFKWDEGKLYNLVIKDNHIEENEVLYVHFQKRYMEQNVQNINRYFIIPNKFIQYQEISIKQIQSICDLSKNELYCDQILNKTKSQRNKFRKIFSVTYWKNKFFLLKMKKICKIEPYKFSKGGF